MNWIGLYTFARQEVARFLRVSNQTLITPWITAFLYIFIFGEIVGRRIGVIAGVSYIDFVVPGLLMMNVMQAAFSQTSFSLFFQRFVRHIDEVLTAPLSYFEILLGYLVGGIVRGLITGAGVYALALFFTSASLEHFLAFVFYLVSVSVIFSLAGLLAGMWSENFDQLALPATFLIMPLTFLGGLFYSVNMLPQNFQILAFFNPFLYFVDGLRYSMIGVAETNLFVGVILILALIFLFGFWVWHLLKKGYKIRT